jgi:hypothetical protein
MGGPDEGCTRTLFLWRTDIGGILSYGAAAEPGCNLSRPRAASAGTTPCYAEPNALQRHPIVPVMKIIFWIVAIIFLIGLAVVFGLGSLIF